MTTQTELVPISSSGSSEGLILEGENEKLARRREEFLKTIKSLEDDYFKERKGFLKRIKSLEDDYFRSLDIDYPSKKEPK